MHAHNHVFYHSENGDQWLLAERDDGIVTVRHQPNHASGGLARDVSLRTFLEAEQATPQGRALRNLLESLVPAEPSAGEAELLQALRSRRRQLSNRQAAGHLSDKRSELSPDVRDAIAAFLERCQKEAQPFATAQAIGAIRTLYPGLELSDADLMEAVISEAEDAGFEIELDRATFASKR